MTKEEMKKRTKKFALRIMKLIDLLPNTQKGRVISYQLMKSGTSTGANYRAACRARSRAEYIAKLQIVLEEADENVYWLELIDEGGLLPDEDLSSLTKEADKITAIVYSTLDALKNKGNGQGVAEDESQFTLYEISEDYLIANDNIKT